MQKGSLKENTARGLFWGGFSSAAQQLLNLFFGIFLARILNAEDYGMVGMITIFSLIATTVLEGGFISALTNKKNRTHADYNAVFWLNCLIGVTFYVVLYFLAPLIAAFYNTPELTALARYVFLSVLISSFSIAQHAYLFSNLMVREKGIALTISLLVSGIVGLIMAYKGMSYWGIATQGLIYTTLVTLFYWHFSPWRPTFSLNFAPIRGMLSYSSKLLITNLFVHINNNLFPVILGRFYTKSEVGYYTQANKWNTLGYTFVMDMLHNISQPVFSKVNNDNARLQAVFRKLLRFTSFITFPVMLGISFIAKEFIVIAITDKWLKAVNILQLLCISGAFAPITRLYSNLLLSRGKSAIHMWNSIILCLILLLGIVLIHPYGMYNMFGMYVVVNIGWLGIWHYFVWREIKLSLWNALKDMVPYITTAAGSILVTYFLTTGIENNYLLLISKIAITAILYCSCLWLCGSKIFKESVEYITKKKI